MSAGSLPLHIEPFKWADRGAEVEVTLALKSFPRLLQGALSDQGEVTVRCDFARDTQGRAWLEGSATTTLSLTCQRCLEGVPVSLDAEFRLALLADEADADELSGEDDYIVVGADALSLYDVVEDELILTLPLVARHEDCTPSYVPEPLVEADPPRENPFQVLAAVKPQDPDQQ